MYSLSLFFLIVTVYAQYMNLTIMAWNVQIFGPSKMSKPDVVKILVPTFRLYDIGVIQEIQDGPGTAIAKLVTMINACNFTEPPCPQYKLEISPRLGPSGNEEQYGFIYRPDKVNITHVFQYPDPNTWYSRPPYHARFKAHNFTFVLGPIHTRPSEGIDICQSY